MPVTPSARLVRSLASGEIYNTYAPNGFALLWTRDARPTPQALAVIALLQHADEKGLAPADYWQPRPIALGSDADLARFDVAITTGLLRYLSDVHVGRIDPRRTGVDLDVDAKRLYLPPLVQRMASANDPVPIASSVEPQHDDYRRLLVALAQYRRMSDGAPLPVVAKLQPGDAYDALPQLAETLRRYGDLAGDAPVGARYEGALVDAVKHFQSRHGLDADGIISARTFAALNVPPSARVAQIEASLERWRWMPDASDAPAVIVNIPEFGLRTSDDALTMRVIVGKAAGHRTPLLGGAIEHVVFRPTWSVPANIQRNEIVPKVTRDREWLSRNGFELVSDSGSARAAAIDDATIEQLRARTLRVRQRPGASNALGLVKFVFPNEHDVYLHSTPSPSLFARTRRDFSHGCIRVEDPVALAAWSLREQPQWTPEKIRAAIAGQRDDLYVRLPQAIPVLLLYATAVAEKDGSVHFYEDIYGHDNALARASERVRAVGLVAER
ncbi:MAG TPA: L,D-transpeptidase family protein [Thermoanaerobaculia bacterium]